MCQKLHHLDFVLVVAVAAIAMALDQSAWVPHILASHYIQVHVLEVVVLVEEHTQSLLVDHHVYALDAPSTHLSTAVCLRASSSLLCPTTSSAVVDPLESKNPPNHQNLVHLPHAHQLQMDQIAMVASLEDQLDP